MLDHINLVGYVPELMKEKIAIKHGKGLVVNKGKESNPALAATFNTLLMRLGFVATKQLSAVLETRAAKDFEALVNVVMPVLRELKGADASYKPMYPNFPSQVMEASEYELYRNAILHYWSDGQWLPEYQKLAREQKIEVTSLIPLNALDETAFKAIFTRLLGSNESLSEFDKKAVKWFLDTVEDLPYPESIPFKENLCLLAGYLINDGRDISKIVKTATDVLRVATYLSGGDVSLATNTKFKSLPRSQRKLLIRALEKVVSEEDIARHRNKWGKLFHNLHVREHSDSLAVIADKLRNNKRMETFNGKVESLISKKDIQSVVDLLKKRPGDFARRLDHLLRISGKKSYIINNFRLVADDVDTRVLLQVLGHLNTREEATTTRTVFPKGNTQKVYLVRKNLEALSAQTINKLRSGIEESLTKCFSALESLGKVYIDPALTECPIPSGQRSASEGLIQVARGTRLPLPADKNTLRFFIYWVGQDIDLSASLHDEDFSMQETIAYYNLKNDRYGAYHSGDITNAIHGACEFIDITMDKALEAGHRYVVMNVRVFRGPSFKEHDICYAGWMTREHPHSNEIFEPKTVENKINVMSESKSCIPVVFDLLERKAIWTDIATPSYGGGFSRVGLSANNVGNNKGSMEDTLAAVTTMKNKVSLHKLFSLHAKARGKIVSKRDDATTVFSLTEGITPKDIAVIASDYLK